MREVRMLVEDAEKRRGKKLTYHVTTFGCQMNAHDSEKLKGMLDEMGYSEIESENADFVIYNTCTVRENANLKVYGRLGRLHSYKKKNPDMIIGLCGCMMEEKDVVEKIKSSYKFVDIIFGTHNLFQFAQLTLRRLQENKMVIGFEADDNSKIIEDLPSRRKYSFKSGVNIMYGCNNFCSYCIVPYVRGREYSREAEDILSEIKALADDGVKEIMLLGQNVNSYGKTLAKPVSFAELLRKTEEIEGIERIRFMTSHPKDLSDELIDVMAESKKICKHLHLPVQSGSSELLKKMNRHYTKESYLELAEKIQKRIPDIALTTDIIVGFPGETDEDFEDTMDVVRKVRYDSAFTFIYSKRTGTPAAGWESVPEDVVKERFDRLLNEVQSIASEKAMAYEGKTLDVLVEGINEHDSSLVTGRLSNNSTVHFAGDESLIGKIVPVYLKECKGFYYLGERK
ncbi:MAG: tRNA (N6-isopentenyl adenosine(37)-C2)-methylthiotransferase MiaB [Eubacterium sp.]|nr:tRNA (N6-isopentenyl adenosine(37)-C2)-methylthiotransferase MiaB [Eubacterium sp.]